MNKKLLLLVTVTGCFLAVVLPAAAQEELPPGMTMTEEQEEPADNGGQLPFGYVRSIDAMTSGFATADSLDLAAEYATMNRNYDQAIHILKNALKKDDDDLDIHKAYAQALEGKIKLQPEPDPKMFNDCVKEWLIVLRTERGDEKGINNSKGVGLPLMNHLYEDEQFSMEAQLHLKQLVGRVPKQRETDDQFLKAVCKPAELEVKGKLLSSPPEKSQPPVLWMK